MLDWIIVFVAVLGLGIGWLRERSARLRERAWAESEREAANDALATERQRIYDDLHDDLGARLLQLVYEASTPQQADLARAALQDLRDVVSRSRGAPGTLEDVLSDIRREAAQRLGAIGAELRWEQPDTLPDHRLPHDRALHLYRIVREAITNALRHAPGRRIRVRVRVAESSLDVELTDDGHAGPPTDASAGRGLSSMQQRAQQLDGEIAWLPGTEGGTKVLLTMPLATPERS